MLYTENVKEALIVANEKLKNTISVYGVPEMVHCVETLLRLKTEEEIIVSLIMNTDVNKFNENKKIKSALKLLRKNYNNIDDYVESIKANTIARNVLIARYSHLIMTGLPTESEIAILRKARATLLEANVAEFTERN